MEKKTLTINIYDDDVVLIKPRSSITMPLQAVVDALAKLPANVRDDICLEIDPVNDDPPALNVVRDNS